MADIEIFRTLIDYNQALTRRLWEGIMELSDEQFVRALDYSHGSIRDQMVHIATVEARWLRGLQGRPHPRAFSFDPEDYPTRQSVREIWLASTRELAAYVDGLGGQDLDRVPRGMRGPVWQVLAHLVIHGADHRAQVLRALHDFGAPTFDQDLILHLWAP